MDLPEDTQRFLEKAMIAVKSATWVKCTITKPSSSQEWSIIFMRPVRIKEKEMVQAVIRYPTQDITKNYHPDEWYTQMETWLNQRAFKEINFFADQYHMVWKSNKKGKVSLRILDIKSEKVQPSLEHNREKNYLIPPDAKFLNLLGLSSSDGKILSDGQRKYRQINKYIEILSGLISESSFEQPLRIMDMGSGLGYLTFALYDFLTHTQDLKIEMTGVELRPNLVDKCNLISQELNFEGLSFIAGDINKLEAIQMDILIALHACDIATDMAIAAGIKAGAQLIILAPCCQKQIRRSIDLPFDLHPLLKHGILLERQAELLTDSLRSLYLELYGYKSRVFEFVSTEHTAKNIMITAEKSRPRLEALEEINRIKTIFGIREHYLETLLSDK